MISFVAPWMLIALAAASAPIILHFLQRRTARRVLWGAWMFLKQSLARRRRKLLVEDMLLLVLRTLVIILAAFAFARPFLPEIHLFGAKGMDKDVVVVIDISASMRLKDASGRSAIERALSEAAELVRLSPKGTAFGLVVGDRRPEILTASPISSKREILELLDKIKVRDDTMDAPRTIAAAGQVLAAGNNPAKEVIIFGDGQACGWRVSDNAEWGRVERIFSRFPRRVPVIWRVLEGPGQVKNVAIAAVTPSRRIVGIDRPLDFSVTVANSGSEAFSPGDVALALDGKEICRAAVGQILPGLSRSFTFPCRFDRSGQHELVASLAVADDIPADSVVTNHVEVIEQLPVLLVDGHPSKRGYARPTAFLEAALRPELRGTNDVFLVSPRTVRAAELEHPDVFNGVSVAVLCDVPLLSPLALENLSAYVRNGGGLLTIPGEKAQTPFYTNDVFGIAWTNWHERLENIAFEKVPVAARVEFDEMAFTNGVDVLGRFSDGAAALVATRFGRGRSVIAAFPFTFEASVFPARPSFVPFVHELVADIAATNSFPAAENLAWRAQEGSLAPLDIKSLEAVSARIDLGFARCADDALAAVVGRSFGVEIGRPAAIIALLLLLAELWFCRKIDRERGGQERSIVRFILRALMLMALIWLALQICWVHDVSRVIHRRVAVLVDESLSMMRQDVDDSGMARGPVRFNTATNIAARLEGNLSGRYDVEPFRFGGTVTDYSAALETVLEHIASEELAGAVFVTDGRSTGESSPEAAARRFARIGAKISSVLVGSTTNCSDVAIEKVAASESIFLGDKVRALVRVRADRMGRKPFAVKLMEGDRVIETQEFTPEGDCWKKELHFVHDPVGKGVKHYRIELAAPDGDSEAANNSWPFDVSVSDDRTNVLVADRRARWEFRYLRNLFYARDKSVHLQYFLSEPDRLAGSRAKPDPAADATREFGDAQAGSLPKTRDDWCKFDVIILGDLPPDVLDETAIDDIRYAVEERGAMLVVTAGERFMPRAYTDTALSALLPVSWTNESGVAIAEWVAQRSPFALSPSARSHPATTIASSTSENDRIWNSLPPTSAHLQGLNVKTSAEVLLFAGDSTCLDAPLMVVRETGRGKCVFFATDEMWLLRYRTGDTYHHRFWGNLVKWGAGEKLRDGNRYARVGTDRLQYAPGETVRVVLRLRDKNLFPLVSARPIAEITRPDGTLHSIDLAQRDDANGYYEVGWDDTAAEGTYQVRIRGGEAETSLGELWPEPLTSTFVVGRGLQPVEFAHLSADSETLNEMARLTGGKVCSADDFDDLSEAFGVAKSELVEHIEDPIWDHPLGLVVLVLAAIAVWILRKRKGLA